MGLKCFAFVSTSPSFSVRVCILHASANILFLTFSLFWYEKKINRFSAIARSFTPSFSISFQVEVGSAFPRTRQEEPIILVQRALHLMCALHSRILGGFTFSDGNGVSFALLIHLFSRENVSGVIHICLVMSVPGDVNGEFFGFSHISVGVMLRVNWNEDLRRSIIGCRIAAVRSRVYWPSLPTVVINVTGSNATNRRIS